MASKNVVTTRAEDGGDWNQIKQEITCSICYELFTDPRTLPCLHTFCKSCIQTSVETGLAEVPEGYFECPLCRAHVQLPANGIEGISSNFSIKRLIEIYQKRQEIETDTSPKCGVCTDRNSATTWCIECDCPICSECDSSHKRTKVFSQHKIIPMKDFTSDPKHAIEVSLNPGACPSHPDQVLKFYCYTCDQTICVECALLDHPRGEHKFDSIGKVIIAEKEEVLKTAAPLEPMRISVCEAMSRVAASKDDITARYQVNMAEVNSLFDELHRILDKQRDVILKKLESSKATSHKSLDIQSSDLSFLESKLRSCQEFVHNLIDKSNATEILSFKTQIAGRVASLMEQALLEPVCTADSTVWCIDPAKFVAMSRSLCHAFCSPHPTNCTTDKPTRHYIQVDGIPVNAVTIIVSLKDSCGNPVPKQAQHLEMTSDEVSHLMVEEQDKNGVYRMTYQPIGIAAHAVIIKWNGCNITQCDIPELMRNYTTLLVDIPVREVEKKEEDDVEDIQQEVVEVEMELPYAIGRFSPVSLSSFEVSLVSDDRPPDSDDDVHAMVHGELVDEVRSEESYLLDDEGDQLDEPQAEPVEDMKDDIIDDDLSIGDNDDENSDNEHDSDGSQNVDEVNDQLQLQVLNTYGPDEEVFGLMYGLANGPNDELIVVDTGNHKLIVFDKDLQYSHTIGEEGEAEGQFINPLGVVCNEAGQLFVADARNSRVQVFKVDGEFVSTFGRKGSEYGEFDYPNGLALSSTGVLFVGDPRNQRIQVFDTEDNNKFLHSFGQDKLLNNYAEFALSHTEDKLFVADGGSSIKVFSPQGQFMYSLLPDPGQCGAIPSYVCCTPDGHLLIATLLSTRFLSVYHEDGTLVTTCDREWDAYKFHKNRCNPNFDKTSNVLIRRNGQVVVAFHNHTINNLIFDSEDGIVLL
ncbi:tripartite motif-containing protein 2-like [Dysidea avara]|uniref:tripartite motif-containing protein 2-like n=1 Tax=Dysidea avara TaxID=196820 RepID=UPI00331B916B